MSDNIARSGGEEAGVLKIGQQERPVPWCRDYEGREYTFEEYFQRIRAFHGYAAPGLIIGGRMVDLALERLPAGILFDAICETSYCLPDAIQILTLCTTGNGWLRVIHLGRFALTLYDKYQGKGVRVSLNPARLDAWPEVKTWFYKLKPKAEQDTPLLRQQIRDAGSDLFTAREIQMQSQWLRGRELGKTVNCPLCGEAFPEKHGAICRGCQGEAPYEYTEDGNAGAEMISPPLTAVPTEAAVGHRVLHDMTQIIPGESKGPAFRQGRAITAGDVCRLQQMGRQHLFLNDEDNPDGEWVHENDAAVAFARRMAGEGVIFKEPPSEGKITFTAARDGLLVLDRERLEAFNLVPNVMCATRKTYTVVSKGRQLGGTRAIPLYLHKNDFQKAVTVLAERPLFRVLPMRKARVGILVTGTEVFRGLIQDGFRPVIRAKVEKLGCRVISSAIVPDDREAISEAVQGLIRAGADLVVTTAGLSVDPDDVTRHGLTDAGATDMRYGAAVLPGAMTLLARIGAVQVIGVPACALYFKTTSFDLLLPRLLAGAEITRRDLARFGHGGFCLGCKTCRFPRCPFGK
ncbi:trehalose-binding protein [Desulfonema ishimotonii]|uniref:Trehalose-binding protein n=1 Tax=Desulfonema ishimotonii TaxID=45657 RepID=A0A401FYS7_9BACT|nr:FmdE family protein [Desulfonema ishimotonii]GBC62121.1 trehalose-binding protein [Desulfonema ishimotonii]